MAPTVEPPSSNSPAGQARPTEDEPTSFTKSPQSKRVVKKARITSPGAEANIDAPFLTSTTPPPFADTQQPLDSRPHDEDTPSTPQLPATLRDVVADESRRLESLVDSVLATVIIIQAASPHPVAFSSHMQGALDLLNKLVAPAIPINQNATTCPAPHGPHPETGTPTTPSYAQATRESRTTHTVEHTAKPSPAGHQPSHNPTRLQISQRPRHSPYRLIVRWPGYPVPQTSDSLQTFTQDLTNLINMSYRRETGSLLELAGANVTKSSNIVIHTKVPQTAAEMLQFFHSNDAADVRMAARFIPGFTCPKITPEVELDIPWHGIVIHDIPAQPLMESYRGDEGAPSLWDAVVEQSGLPEKAIRDLQVLCREEDMEKKDRLSIKIMLDDPRLCEHICRDKTYIFGTQCCVSRYRPRSKQRRPPAS